MKPRLRFFALLAAFPATCPLGAQPAAFTDRTDEKVPVTLAPFVIDTSQDRGYQATNAITATKLNTPLYNLPISVSVATEEFIRDLGTPDIMETIRFIGNVERSFTPEGTGQYTIRGSALGATSVYVNSRLVLSAVEDTYNISRIEVAKGPASTTMGVSSAVGVINYLIKKPDLRNSFSQLFARVGSNDNQRVTFDTNVPYSVRGLSSGLRVMGVLEDSKDFIPYVSRKTKGLTLTNTTRLTNSLTLEVFAEWLKMDRVQSSVLPESGIGNIGAAPPHGKGGGFDANLRDINGAVIPLTQPVSIGGVPVTTGMFVSNIYDLVKLASIGGPENGKFFESQKADFSLTWQGTEKFAAEAFYSIGREGFDDIRKEGTNVLRHSGVRVTNGVAVYDPAGGRYFQNSFVTYQPQPFMIRHYGRVSGVYHFASSFMKQDLRIGGEIFDQGPRYQRVSRITTPGTVTPLALNVFVDDISNDTTSINRWYAAGGVNTPIQQSLLADQMYKALYATAQGSYWKDRIYTVVGVRRDFARQRSWTSYTVPLGGSFANDPKRLASDVTYVSNSPLYSVSVEPVRGVHVYYNQSKSFGFNQAGALLLNFKGTVLDDPKTAAAKGLFDPANPFGPPPPPETGSGREVGLKFNTPGGRLSATLAFYSNKRLNIRTNWPSSFLSDLLGPTNPAVSGGATVAGVTQEAKGWEFEVQASPSENFTFAANYSEPQVTTTANPANPVAVGVPNAANFKSTFNLLARYSVTRGRLRGAYLGSAMQFRGPYLLTSNNGRLYSESYSIYNPFFGYELPTLGRFRTSFRLDVHNAFDTHYSTSNIIGEPRSLFASMTVRFR